MINIYRHTFTPLTIIKVYGDYQNDLFDKVNGIPYKYVIKDKISVDEDENVIYERMKGGLTGYAQFYGKYNTNALDKLKLDLLYITNYSLLLIFGLFSRRSRYLFRRRVQKVFLKRSASIFTIRMFRKIL